MVAKRKTNSSESRNTGHKGPSCCKGTNVGLCRWLAGWLAGWLGRWVAGCLAGWVAGWLGGWVDGWLVGWLAYTPRIAGQLRVAPGWFREFWACSILN